MPWCMPAFWRTEAHQKRLRSRSLVRASVFRPGGSAAVLPPVCLRRPFHRLWPSHATQWNALNALPDSLFYPRLPRFCHDSARRPQLPLKRRRFCRCSAAVLPRFCRSVVKNSRETPTRATTLVRGRGGLDAGGLAGAAGRGRGLAHGHGMARYRGGQGGRFLERAMSVNAGRDRDLQGASRCGTATACAA